MSQGGGSFGGGSQQPPAGQQPQYGMPPPPQYNFQQPDMSMGYARTFQQPSFYNPFSGYYGAGQQYGSGGGGFAPQGGGFGQPYGGFGGGFGGFGGFNQLLGGLGQLFGSGFGQQMGNFQQQFQQPYQQPYQQQFQAQPYQPQPSGNAYAQRFTRPSNQTISPPRVQPPTGYVENPEYQPIPEGMVGTMGPERIRYMPAPPEPYSVQAPYVEQNYFPDITFNPSQEIRRERPVPIMPSQPATNTNSSDYWYSEFKRSNPTMDESSLRQAADQRARIMAGGQQPAVTNAPPPALPVAQPPAPFNPAATSGVGRGTINYVDETQWGGGAEFDKTLIPQGFNWQRYVQANPDLQQAGIDTPIEAQRHYALHGRNEGRPGDFISSQVQAQFGAPEMAQSFGSSVYDPRMEALQRQMQQQFTQRESSMTDYQKLMERKQMAGRFQPNQFGSGGLEQNFNISAPSDFEIAKSLGWNDPHAARDMLEWARDPMADQVAKERAEQAKAYLSSIGYGQAGFDPSKYEVKRQPVSRGPSSGLGGLFAGLG